MANDLQQAKLARVLNDEALAADLVTAGLDNPAKIRAASKAELERAVGKTRAGRVPGRLRARAKGK
jgi:hypothetical protein